MLKAILITVAVLLLAAVVVMLLPQGGMQVMMFLNSFVRVILMFSELVVVIGVPVLIVCAILWFLKGERDKENGA